MISVVIATSPGRQADLACCLQALARQTATDFEVIVSDDGSEGMQDVMAPFRACFCRLEYLWRPNDRCLSRTRNAGVNAALGDRLVLLNTDVLLHAGALRAYAAALERLPRAVHWGYIGCRKRVSAPSLWFPERRVNWLDFRFFPLAANRLWIHPQFHQAPHRFAGGHHFALTRAAWEAIGPMDEAFIDWGEEDVEFALRALSRGYSMTLFGDAWAEHLDHPYAEAFHRGAAARRLDKLQRIQALEQQLLQQGPPAGVRAEVLFGDQLPILWEQIRRHYLPYAPDALEAECRAHGA